MSLFDFVDKIKLKVQDDADILDNLDIENILISALQQFSKDLPYEKVADISGDGGYDYAFPASWQDGFSSIKKVEYPAGEREPLYLEDEDWTIYDNGSTKKLRFLNHDPQSGETIRLTFTIAYLSTTIDNIPATQQDAFCNLAASICCEAMANHYAQSSDATIDVDSVDYGGKAAIYGNRAKSLRKLYEMFLTTNKDSLQAASATGDWDSRPSWGDNHLLHDRKMR